jgi:hypothetical protein
LDSWKSIAEYLKRSPRTVQRWHAEFGLPVHHFGGSKGPVFSYSDELDAWLSGFSEAALDDPAGADAVLDLRKRKSAELAAQADELWGLRSEENLSAIAALYRAAIDRDAGNAGAFVGLSNALVLAALSGVMAGSAAYPRAYEALQRAVRLGDETPEVRCAAAWLQLVYERKWRRAREGFEDALGKHPGSSHSLAGRALVDIVEGNLGCATRRLEEAWRQNTFASSSSDFLAWSQYLARDYELAIDTISQARAGGQCGSLGAAVEALSLIQSGSVAPHLPRLEAMTDSFPRSLVLRGVLGRACAAANQKARAREIMSSLKHMKGDSGYALALVFMGMDERHQAFICLQTSFAEGSLWSLGFQFDPILEPLHEDQNFAGRLKKLWHSA